MSEQNQAVAMNAQAGAQKKMKLSSKIIRQHGAAGRNDFIYWLARPL